MGKITVRDLTVVRQYYINNINLLVRIDFVKKKMSFVQPSVNGNGYVAKEWLFAQREPEYLRTWTLIFDAMKQATKMVIKELDDIKEAEFKSTVRALAEASKHGK